MVMLKKYIEILHKHHGSYKKVAVDLGISPNHLRRLKNGYHPGSKMIKDLNHLRRLKNGYHPGSKMIKDLIRLKAKEIFFNILTNPSE
jgi:DNA-binding Xre family transcriptional regulator